jgi:hypothetical protein
VALMLSPLAVEILDDMEGEASFAAGATVSALMGWLGATKAVIRDTLDELLRERRIYRVKNVYYHGKDAVHAPLGVRFHGEIVSGVRANKPQVQISRELGISNSVVHFTAPSHHFSQDEWARLAGALRWRYGPARAKAIMAGTDIASNADVQRWHALGEKAGAA